MEFNATEFETTLRPIAFCLAVAFVFRYTPLAGPNSRKAFNYTTFAFVLCHMGLKASENSDHAGTVIMAVITVAIFHFLASILIPAFVFFNLTDLIKVYLSLKSVVDKAMGGTERELGEAGGPIMDYLPPIIVLAIWVAIFPYADMAIISILDALTIFSELEHATMYQIV